MNTLVRYVRYSALLIVGLASLAFGQVTGSVSLQKNDGTVITGRIRAQSDDDVTVESAAGFVTVSKAQLTTKSLSLLTESVTDELTALRERVDQQEKLIAALRNENQSLRAALANQPAPTSRPQTSTPATAAVPATTAEAQALKYWMSSTGKRHNSNCRYYGSGNGRPCGAQDGAACKICGG